MVEQHLVLYYQTAAERVPFREWLESVQDATAVAAIRARLDRLGSGLLGDCRSVGDGVTELRIDVGPGYRLFLARPGGNLIIVLCGGDKRAQDKDIKRAKRFRNDYEARTRAAGSPAG
jgi:putative addiction module killer protein